MLTKWSWVEHSSGWYDGTFVFSLTHTSDLAGTNEILHFSEGSQTAVLCPQALSFIIPEYKQKQDALQWTKVYTIFKC